MQAPKPAQYTILFADIAKSTSLYERLGDTRALALINRCMKKLNEIVLANDGIVIKTIGDEIMCAFENPEHAASAAVCMNECIACEPNLMSHQIRLRIGMHHGPTLVDNQDFFGDSVNVASRMVSLAKAGQIITNRTTLDLMNPCRLNTARLVDQTQVRGKQKIFDIYELSWGQPEELTMVSMRLGDIIGRAGERPVKMILECRDRKLEISRTQPIVSLGRDATNDVVVDNPKISRLHARIELRRNKFILVDQSTNGTFFLPDDGKMVMLHRDEISLPAQGRIVMGEPVTEMDAGLVVHFHVHQG